MVEFNCTTNKITNIVEYPEDLITDVHCCCKYNNKIYIIDGEHGEITLFDPVSKTYSKQLDIPKIGWYASAVVVYDRIHILHGHKNRQHYLIYNPNKNTVIDHAILTQAIRKSALLFYQSQNRILKFAGYCSEQRQKIDQFMVSSVIKPGEDTVPEWTTKPEWKLPIPLQNCGYVLYKHYIIIIGGSTTNNQFVDDVYLLDLRSDNGWKRVRYIECPMPSHYLAILAVDKRVHIFARGNVLPNWKDSELGHYSLPITTIIGSDVFENDEECKDTKSGLLKIEE